MDNNGTISRPVLFYNCNYYDNKTYSETNKNDISYSQMVGMLRSA